MATEDEDVEEEASVIAVDVKSAHIRKQEERETIEPWFGIDKGSR